MYFNEIISHIAHILDVFVSVQNIRECLGFGYSVLHRGTSLGQPSYCPVLNHDRL